MLSVWCHGGESCQIFEYPSAGRTSVIAFRERLIPLIPTRVLPRHVPLLTGSDQVADAFRLDRNKTIPLLECRNPPTQAKVNRNAIPSQGKRLNGTHPQNTPNPGETSPHIHPFLSPTPRQAFAWVGSDGHTGTCSDFVLRSVASDQAEGSRHVFCVTKCRSTDGCRDAVLRQFAALEGNQGHSTGWRRRWEGGQEDEESQIVLLERFTGQDV